MNTLDFLGFGGLLHSLEAFWWAKLEPAAVIHIPDRLQKHTHFRNASTDRKGHCTSMVERIIPQTHLRPTAGETLLKWVKKNVKVHLRKRQEISPYQSCNVKKKIDRQHFYIFCLTCVPTVMLGMEDMPALDFGFLFFALAFSSIFFRWLKGTTPLQTIQAMSCKVYLPFPIILSFF